MAHLHSIILAAILVVIGPAFALGQNVSGKRRPPQSSQVGKSVKPAENPEVRSLLNDSESLPAEFSADVSLALVENGLIRNGTLKARVITRAFEKASAAEDDVMRRPFGVNVEETSQGLHAIASSVTRFNRVSLQARAVQQVAAADPRKVRQLFESMQGPQLIPVSCNQPWFFVPDAYYDALATVLQRGFSEGEIAGGVRAGYVNSVISHVHYHVQVVPVARLLSAGSFTEQEFRTIIPVYSAKLAEVRDDPMSFSILMSAPDGFLGAIKMLLASIERRSVDSRALLQAFRDYMVLNFKGLNCKVPNWGATDPAKDLKSPLPPAIVQFNETFRSRLKATNLDVISENEIKNDAKASSPDEPLPSRWNSLSYVQVLQTVQKLNTPLTQKELAEGRSERDATWLSQAQDALAQLSSWSDEDEAEVDFFHQKAILLQGLSRKTIGTRLHAEALDAFVRFLEQNSYQDVSPIDWFFSVKILLAESARSEDASADLKRLIDSQDPVLSVYARLHLLLQSAKRPPNGKHPSKGGNTDASPNTRGTTALSGSNQM